MTDAPDDGDPSLEALAASTAPDDTERDTRREVDGADVEAAAMTDAPIVLRHVQCAMNRAHTPADIEQVFLILRPRF